MSLFKKNNIDNYMKEKIQKIAMTDSLKPGRLSLCLIALLELYFIITWLIFKHAFTNISEMRYFICYMALFVFSVVALILSYVFERDKENGYKKLTVLQTIAAVFILLWTVLITIFDADHHTEFSYIIYATVVVILPAVIYVNLALLNVLYLACDIILMVFTVIIKPDNYLSTVLNFLVFAVVSLFACNIYKNAKIMSIKREIEFQSLSERDYLTGLYNRQKLSDISRNIINENIESQTPVSCVMTDIDDFKQINDIYGHSTGDAVLKNVAHIVKEEAKKNGGFTFRYGGEEFLIVFSDCSGSQACEAVKKIQKRLEKGVPGFTDKVTLSFGIYTAVPTDSINIEQYCLAADNLLYTSKQSGKNKYTVWEKSADTVAAN